MKTDVPFIEKLGRGQLINTDLATREAYMKRYEFEKSKDSEVSELQDQLNNLSKEMQDIKTLLQQLVKVN